MSEATDRRADQALSHLGDGLAAHVTMPPVTRVFRRATPFHRALFRLEDMAGELSVPSVPHVIRMATPRRRAVVAGCSICALGAVGAALVLIPRASNGSFGPSELWAQHAGGSDSTSQSGELIMPNLPNDLVAQATNQQSLAPPVPAQLAAAKLAAAAPVAAKPAAVKPAPARTTAARQVAAQSRGTQLPPTTQRQLATSTTLTATPRSPAPLDATSATAKVEVTLTARVSPWLAAGSVQFEGFGSVKTVTVTGGTATTQVPLPEDTYTLTAVFNPSNPTAFTSSTSLPVSYRVYTVAAPTTTTTAPAPPLASLAAANTIATLKPTVTAPTPPPVVQPPVVQPPVVQPPVEQPPVEQVPGRTGRGRSDRGGAAPLAEQLPQQVPAEQPLVQRGRRH
jgi:hypothetical protein